LIIYLDLDDVLCDFVPEAYKLMGLENPYLSGYTGTEMSRPTGLTHKEFWRKFNRLATADWWASLPKLSHADELIELAEGAADDVAICSRPQFTEACYAGKLRWVREHTNLDLILIQQKWRLWRKGAILIDDSPFNIRMFTAGSIVFKRPWNEGMTFEEIKTTLRSYA
jgi:hypothetical protein